MPHNISSFLKLGYFLDYENPNYKFNFSNVDKDKYSYLGEEELKEIGSKLFKKSIENNFKCNQRHVVPLSGGLDSRALLAELLEFTDSTNIYTYTFGSTETLDYEIGNNIAKYAGTNHRNFPIHDYKYSTEELIDNSRRIGHQTALFHHPPMKEVDDFVCSGIVWSGFLGGEITNDVNILNDETKNVYNEYLNKHTYAKNINLTTKKNDLLLLPYLNKSNSNTLNPYEQICFENRQLKFIAPHVLMEGTEYRTPFYNSELINYYLSIPDIYRKNQYLYKKILLENYNDLFSLPTKNNLGLPINVNKITKLNKRIVNKILSKINKKYIYKRNINYLDFENAIREKEDLKKVIVENINDLDDRKIIDWINIKNILKDHLNENMNYGNALLLLTSLEIHIKALSDTNA